MPDFLTVHAEWFIDAGGLDVTLLAAVVARDVGRIKTGGPSPPGPVTCPELGAETSPGVPWGWRRGLLPAFRPESRPRGGGGGGGSARDSYRERSPSERQDEELARSASRSR